MLSDDVLLEIFDFNVLDEDDDPKDWMDAWQTYVHVCRRWRSVVFGSPRRLGLQLVCTRTTSARDTLDVWPALPLVIKDFHCKIKKGRIALLERSELVRRVTHIKLWEAHLEDISEAMEVPFPELTYLLLSNVNRDPVLPLSDSFLGGSAPRLEIVSLSCIPFPGLPKLLSSATHLKELHLVNIPHSGYFSPEAMAACLSLLTSLCGLSLEFKYPRSRPNRESIRPLPSTHTVLPALERFWFRGISEYLEDVVARIDAPRLNRLHVTFFNDIVFDTPQFTRLISDSPTFNAFKGARVYLGTIASIILSSNDGILEVQILCRELDWQVSHLEQVFTSSLSLLFPLEDLYIDEYRFSPPEWQDNIDNAPWLELLHPFTTVKNLFLFEKIAPRVVPALQELVGGRTMEVLPTLQNVFIEGLQSSGTIQEGVGKFVAARQLTSHPIVVSDWEKYLSSPQVPHTLDLSSNALPINAEEPAQPGLPSPVTLAPMSGRLTATSEFPPDFMAASAASTRPSEIDLSLPEEGPTMAPIGLDLSLGSYADGPVELDLEGMDIDMSDVDVSLFVPTANPFDNTTTTLGNNPSPPSLLDAFNRASATDGDSQASVTALPFDMTINMDNFDFSKSQSDSMMNTSDMGMIDVHEHELLNMNSETGTQAESQKAAGNTYKSNSESARSGSRKFVRNRL